MLRRTNTPSSEVAMNCLGAVLKFPIQWPEGVTEQMTCGKELAERHSRHQQTKAKALRLEKQQKRSLWLEEREQGREQVREGGL